MHSTVCKQGMLCIVCMPFNVHRQCSVCMQCTV